MMDSSGTSAQQPPWLHSAERYAVLDQIDAAQTLQEVRLARAALVAWLRAHPDDLGMRDGDEELSLLEAHLSSRSAA